VRTGADADAGFADALAIGLTGEAADGLADDPADCCGLADDPADCCGLADDAADGFADDAADGFADDAADCCGLADDAATDSGFADDADCLAMGCLPFFDSDSLATAALVPIAGRALFVPTMGR